MFRLYCRSSTNHSRVRCLQSLYSFITSFVVLGYNGGRSFSYFTILSWWGLSFYLTFAALHTWWLLRTGTPLLNRWPRPLQALHSLLFTTIVTFPFIVTSKSTSAWAIRCASSDMFSAVVFWALLASGDTFRSSYSLWSNVRLWLLLIRSLTPRTLAMLIPNTDLSTCLQFSHCAARDLPHPNVATTMASSLTARPHPRLVH